MKYLKVGKAILFFVVILSGFSFITCDAQGVTGKWNRVSGKKFYTPEYAKSAGKAFAEISAETDGAEVVEFKSDHTYTYTLSIAQIKPIQLTGVWSVSGDQLNLKMDPIQPDPKYNPKNNVDQPKNTFKVNGNKLTLRATIPDNNPLKSRMKIEKLEENFEKI
jgi:hypothetical protein